jgi:Family of unknown function (DUF6325)
MSTADVHGPIDVIVFELPSEGATGAIAEAVLDLVDSGTIRLFDVMVVLKEADGSITEVELDTLAGEITIANFSGARSGLLGSDDVDDAGALLEAGSMAVLIVYENAWAVPFVAAARESGAELIASARLSAQDIMDTLDELETES